MEYRKDHPKRRPLRNHQHSVNAILVHMFECKSVNMKETKNVVMR